MFNFFKKEKKKRNEISIFQEFELKPEDYKDQLPKKKDLIKIDDVYFYYNTKFKKNTFWVLTEPEYTQVNEYREALESDNKDFQLNKPKKSSLKKYETDILIHVEEEGDDGTSYVTWWKEDENGELTQVNKSKQSVGFKMKAWLRKEAINGVKLEISTMKKRAYEYEKEELLQMIEKEEKKIKIKLGKKWFRRLAFATLGIGFIPGL